MGCTNEFDYQFSSFKDQTREYSRVKFKYKIVKISTFLRSTRKNIIKCTCTKQLNVKKK